MAVAPSLKKLRSSVAYLKRRGLLPSIKEGGPDARRITTKTKYNGRTLRSIVERYDDVVSRKAVPVKVPRSELRRMQKAGYDTSKGFVLYPVSATQTAYARGGRIHVRNKTGMVRIQFPVPLHQLDDYMRDDKAMREFDGNKGKNDYWGMKIYNGSTNVYANLSQLLDAMRHYNTIATAIDSNSKPKQQEVYQNLELVRIADPEKWEFPGSQRQTRSRASSRRAAKSYRDKMKKAPISKQLEFLDKQAERQREYRARLKGDAKKQYKKDAKKRAKESRKKED